MTPDKPEVPRAKRGTAGPSPVWWPRHLDPNAAELIWSLSPRERIDVVRRLAITGINSRDREVIAAAFLLLDCLRQGELTRWTRDLGLALAGGAHGIKAIRGRDERDARLRSLWRSDYGGLSAPVAARQMVAEFAAYASRRWPRDHLAKRYPEAGPSAMWAYILRHNLTMPGAKRVAAILERKSNP